MIVDGWDNRLISIKSACRTDKLGDSRVSIVDHVPQRDIALVTGTIHDHGLIDTVRSQPWGRGFTKSHVDKESDSVCVTFPGSTTESVHLFMIVEKGL